jgi:hypothetical protein
MLQQDDSAVVGKPPRLPPFLVHEVRPIQLHPCCHKIPERFTILPTKCRQHPLENFVVSYVAILVLHLIHLTVSHIDARELVQSGARNRDVLAMIRRAYLHPIVAIRHLVCCCTGRCCSSTLSPRWHRSTVRHTFLYKLTQIRVDCWLFI